MNQFSHLMPGQKKYIATIVVAIALAFVTLNSWTKWSEAKLYGPFSILDDSATALEGKQGVDVDMPFSMSGVNFKRYIFKANVQTSMFSPRVFKVYPDDLVESLTINDKEVDLTVVPKDALDNYDEGFVIDLSGYLNVGKNDVVFAFRNFRGNVGLSVKGHLQGASSLVLCALWFVLLFWIWVLLTRFFHIRWLHSSMYLLVFIGAVVQVWYICTYNPVYHIGSDAQRHWEQGTDVLRLDLMSMTDPIGYQLYIGALAKLTLKIPALIAFYTTILALIGPWLWYRFLRELQGSKTLAIAGWAGFSLLPSWIAIYGYFMQETLMIPLLGAALWATWRCRRKGDLPSFLLMVTLWVIAGLTRGIAVPMAAVVCTWLWCIQEERIKKAIFSLLILGFIMGPLTYRSYVAVNHFAPHGMGHLIGIYARSGKKTIELNVSRDGARWGYWFGSPSTGAKPFEPFSDWKTQRTGAVKVEVDLLKGKEDWDKAYDNVEVSFDDYLWIAKENLIFLFFGPSWPDNNGSRFIDQLNIGSRFIWAPLLLVIIAGSVFYRKRFKQQWMLPSVIAMWFFIQGITLLSLNEGRYRKPFEGLAIAQVILMIAAIRGDTRAPAPSPSWNHFITRLSNRRSKQSIEGVNPNDT